VTSRFDELDPEIFKLSDQRVDIGSLIGRLDYFLNLIKTREFKLKSS